MSIEKIDDNIFTKREINDREYDVDFMVRIDTITAKELEEKGETVISGEKLGKSNVGAVAGLFFYENGKMMVLRCEIIKKDNYQENVKHYHGGFLERDTADVTVRILREKSEIQKTVEPYIEKSK